MPINYGILPLLPKSPLLVTRSRCLSPFTVSPRKPWKHSEDNEDSAPFWEKGGTRRQTGHPAPRLARRRREFSLQGPPPPLAPFILKRLQPVADKG